MITSKGDDGRVGCRKPSDRINAAVIKATGATGTVVVKFDNALVDAWCRQVGRCLVLTGWSMFGADRDSCVARCFVGGAVLATRVAAASTP